MCAGIGFAYAAMPNLIIEAVPPHQTGEATGFNALIRSVGGSLGSQIAATVLADERRRRRADRLGLQPGVRDLCRGRAAAGVVALFIPRAKRHYHAPLLDEVGGRIAGGRAGLRQRGLLPRPLTARWRMPSDRDRRAASRRPARPRTSAAARRRRRPGGRARRPRAGAAPSGAGAPARPRCRAAPGRSPRRRARAPGRSRARSAGAARHTQLEHLVGREPVVRRAPAQALGELRRLLHAGRDSRVGSSHAARAGSGTRTDRRAARSRPRGSQRHARVAGRRRASARAPCSRAPSSTPTGCACCGRSGSSRSPSWPSRRCTSWSARSCSSSTSCRPSSATRCAAPWRSARPARSTASRSTRRRSACSPRRPPSSRSCAYRRRPVARHGLGRGAAVHRPPARGRGHRDALRRPRGRGRRLRRAGPARA